LVRRSNINERNDSIPAIVLVEFADDGKIFVPKDQSFVDNPDWSIK
jgi:hypothetical protein